MSKDDFTSIDQVKRDMALGVFPRMSKATNRENALAPKVFESAAESLAAGAPGLSEPIRAAVARSITMKVMDAIRKSGDPDMPDLTLCSFEYIAAELRKRGATVNPAPHGGDFAQGGG